MAIKTLPSMSFGESVKTCFSKYANFNGRARRSEFWWFYLLNVILGACTTAVLQWKMSVRAAVEAQLGEALFDQEKMDALMAQAKACDDKFFPIMCVIGVLTLILLLPTLAAWARRLHDVGKSGWLILCIFACGVGGLIPLILAIPDGKPGENQYGPSPKYIPEEVE